MTTSVCERLFANLGMLLLERRSPRHFAVNGAQPEWFGSFLPAPHSPDQPIDPAAIFPFLEHFLEDAEEFWIRRTGGELRSGLWVESTADGIEHHFEAIACQVEEASFLLVRELTSGFEQIQQVYQKGRELSLVHERLVSEIGKKEILLHCVVHDMSGPLTSMMGSLEIAKKEVRSEGTRCLLDLGLIAAKRQGNLIDDLLDCFRAEVMAPDAIAANPATAPDAVACAREVIGMLQPAFTVRGVTGQVCLNEGATELRVVAEKSRLERIFHNLIQNAMRHSPGGGTVSVTFRVEGDFVRIAVEDQGAGVPPDVVPQLFQKFVRRGTSGGKAGLGLFFCRITVEQWGGTIGCEPRPGGGTSFWFRLKRL